MMETAHDSVYLTTSVLPSPLSIYLALSTPPHRHTHTHPLCAWSKANLCPNQTSKLSRGLTRSFCLYLNILSSGNVLLPKPSFHSSHHHWKKNSPFFCVCVCVCRRPFNNLLKVMKPLHIHLYTTFIFSFRNPRTHAGGKPVDDFTSYWT